MKTISRIVAATILLAAAARAADLSESQRAALLKALEPTHAKYDPAERMLRRPFSSPGYHTTLKGGFVHSTRDSLGYAVALLDSGDAQLRQRACDIIDRVIGLQDQDPSHKTYGIWSWFMEEPPEKMSPPDWNWADFCGKELLQVALFHRGEIPAGLMARIDASIQHAARSIQRRNVSVGYTNIAILGTYVTMVAAQTYDLPDLRQYAVDRLHRFHDYTMGQGAFSEYNSPTYTLVSLKALGLLKRDVKDPECLRLIDELYRMEWEEIATHFHAPTRQWAGPHSRCYSTLLPAGTLALIQRATDGRVDFGLADAPIDIESYRCPLPCPKEFEPLFAKLDEPRTVVKTFLKGQRPVIGTTHLHPAFALGSINRGDLWNQRRSLVAYWGTAEKPSYLHLRFLHDGYDFSAAQFFSAQKDGRVLAGINFATDGGDTHINLDRIKNATIKAKDLRLRFEFGGAPGNTVLAAPANLADAARLSSGGIQLRLAVPFARFGAAQGQWQAGRDKDKSFLDVVLYSGPEKTIRLNELDIAAVGVALELSPSDPANVPAQASLQDGRLNLSFGELKLSIPAKPNKAAAMQR